MRERRLDRRMVVTIDTIREATGNGVNGDRLMSLVKQALDEREDEIVLLQTLSETLLSMAHTKRLPVNRTITIDGKPFIVEAELTCAMIAALVGKDFQYQVFLENASGHRADMLIQQDAIVAIVDGMQFYTVPHATFGYFPLVYAA